MRITINEVSPDGTVVQFAYDGGRADGVWLGPATPVPGEFEVDWQVPGRFYWGDDIRVRDARRAVLFLDARDEVLPLIGHVVAIDAAGMLTLGVGGEPITIATAGTPPIGIVGQTVEVDGVLIEVTPRA